MLRRLFGKLLRCEKGSALPLVGFALMAMAGMTGLAVDSGRAYLVQSRLLTALDAAGLAAASSVNTQNIEAEVNEYLRANYPTGYVESRITNVTVTPNLGFTVIDLSATVEMPTTFMAIFGKDTVTMQVQSQITRAQSGLELALVLDVTGSMEGSKLSALKVAAHDMMEILYGDNDTVEDLWVGMVPFSQAVNVGPSRLNWLNMTDYNSRNWTPTSWAGCVQARTTNNRDTTDDLPSDQLFNAYYWPDSNSYNNWVRQTEVPVYQNICEDVYCGRGRNRYVCGQDCEDKVVGYQTVTSYVIDSTHGPNKYCPQPLTMLTASRSTIDDAVDTLVAAGNTHIVTGAVWGWRLLSPDWRGLWGGEMNTNNLPLDYNTPRMNKAMVLMTDGDNVIDNSSKGAYGYLSEGRLGTTSQGTAETRLDERLQTVCTNMKNNNIVIYTIAFGTGISSSSLTMLRNCASQPDYFFNSPTNTALQSAFHAIGDSLANLRVSK